MTFDEALAKVAKLRALAQSNNANEAAAAAAAADHIMQQYRIEAAHVEAIGERAELPDDPITDEKSDMWGARVIHWQLQLMNILARHYSCKLVSGIRSFNGPSASWRQGVHIFGRRSDIALATFQYAYLSVEIARLCELHGTGKGRTWRTSYCMGAVMGARNAMFVSKKEEVKTASSEALVLLDEREQHAQAALSSVYPKLSKTREPTVRDHGAFTRGHKDGAGITQRAGLPSRTQRLLNK